MDDDGRDGYRWIQMDTDRNRSKQIDTDRSMQVDAG